MAGAGEWVAFFERVKKRPSAFYEKCAARLESQDIYEAGDLAEVDEELFVKQLTDATAGEVTFLRQALQLARSDAGHGDDNLTETTAASTAGSGPEEGAAGAAEEFTRLEAAIASEREKTHHAEQAATAMEAKLKDMEAKLLRAAAGAERGASSSESGAAADSQAVAEEAAPPPVFPVVSVLVPQGSTEDPRDFLNRGGLELKWGDRAQPVRKFREKPLPRVVKADLALPDLYLHFLDKRFLPQHEEGLFDHGLRSGNDNSEIQLVLPSMYLRPDAPFLHGSEADTVLGADVARCLQTALDFLKGHGEYEISALEARQGGSFGPRQNYAGQTNTRQLYFGLKAARPKAPINLDKKAWGIPETADLYLFAQNHSSVEHMTPAENEAFQTCIAELGNVPNRDLNKLGEFLKVFYEGGFAYNHKEEVGKGYIPRNVGVAGLGLTPAFPGQMGISTGYPFLMGSSFLRFTDTVPVTIPAISEMSERHGRYGLCFTRCCFVWEDEAFEREGVLNFCSPLPFGGFFYTPSRLRDFRRLGGLLYSFGGAKEELEVPLSVEGMAAAAGGYGGSDSSGAATGTGIARQQQPDDDHRVCVLCLDEAAVMATVPCGHRAFCSSCAPAAQTSMRTCPVCRQSVTNLMWVY